MIKKLICINCPIGCHVSVTIEGENITDISGNNCARGKKYATQETVLPIRILTGTMKAAGCEKPFSVKTDKPVPKTMLLECAMELKKHHPALPITRGDVIISHISGTDANIIATQNFDFSG